MIRMLLIVANGHESGLPIIGQGIISQEISTKDYLVGYFAFN